MRGYWQTGSSKQSGGGLSIPGICMVKNIPLFAGASWSWKDYTDVRGYIGGEWYYLRIASTTLSISLDPDEVALQAIFDYTTWDSEPYEKPSGFKIDCLYYIGYAVNETTGAIARSANWDLMDGLTADRIARSYDEVFMSWVGGGKIIQKQNSKYVSISGGQSLITPSDCKLFDELYRRRTTAVSTHGYTRYMPNVDTVFTTTLGSGSVQLDPYFEPETVSSVWQLSYNWALTKGTISTPTSTYLKALGRAGWAYWQSDNTSHLSIGNTNSIITGNRLGSLWGGRVTNGTYMIFMVTMGGGVK